MASDSDNAIDIERSLISFQKQARLHKQQWQQQSGLSLLDTLLLRCVVEEGPKRMRLISDRFAIKMSTLTSFIDKLERKGVVKRKHSPQDRRVVLLHPTRKGQQLIKKYQHILFRVLNSFLDQIPYPQQEAFLQAVADLPTIFLKQLEGENE